MPVHAAESTLAVTAARSGLVALDALFSIGVHWHTS
jgi:hypothetical protein